MTPQGYHGLFQASVSRLYMIRWHHRIGASSGARVTGSAWRVALAARSPDGRTEYPATVAIAEWALDHVQGTRLFGWHGCAPNRSRVSRT